MRLCYAGCDGLYALLRWLTGTSLPIPCSGLDGNGDGLISADELRVGLLWTYGGCEGRLEFNIEGASKFCKVVSGPRASWYENPATRVFKYKLDCTVTGMELGCVPLSHSTMCAFCLHFIGCCGIP